MEASLWRRQGFSPTRRVDPAALRPVFYALLQDVHAGLMLQTMTDSESTQFALEVRRIAKTLIRNASQRRS
jgi:hypothetical protein